MKNEIKIYLAAPRGFCAGVDRAIEIVKKALDNPNNSVVAKRVKRSEGVFFQFLYQLHKLITLIFTGKNINFGNFSCLTKKDANLISSKPFLSAFIIDLSFEKKAKFTCFFHGKFRLNILSFFKT